MDLTAMFLQGFSTSQQSAAMYKANSASSGGADFESYFKTADANASRKTLEAQKLKDNTIKNNTKDVDKTVNEKTNSSDDANKETVNNKNSSDTEKTKGTEEKTKTDNPNEVKQEVIKKIAEALNVSVEDVQSVLNSLNLTIEELTDPSKLLAFMQKLFEVDNAVDLLSIDGIKEMMKSVKDVAGEYAQFSKTMENTADLTGNATESMETGKEEANEEANNGVMQLADDNMNKDAGSHKAENHALQQEASPQNQKIDADQGGAMLNNNNEEFMSEKESVNVQNIVAENIGKAFNEVLTRTEERSNVNTSDVINQIIDKIKVGITEDMSEIKITLKPEYLGEVSLKIAVNNGIITAQFTAESQKIKEIIEANFNILKDSLLEQGIQVSELTVNVGTERDAENKYNERELSGKSDKRISDIIDASFEEEEIENYVTEDDVAQANVSFTA